MDNLININEKIAASERTTMRTYTRKEPEIIQGVEELCRLCLEKREEGITIFENSLIPSVATKIMMCVGIEMEERDCLPNMICKSCEKELESMYSFRKKCEANYMKLKSHLRAVLKTRKSIQINNYLEKVSEKIDISKEENQENSEVVDAQEYIVYLDMNSDNVNYQIKKPLNIEKHEIENNKSENDVLVTNNANINVKENDFFNKSNQEILNVMINDETVVNVQEELVMKTDIIKKENSNIEEIIENNEINENCANDNINRSNVEMNSNTMLENETMETHSEPQPSTSEVTMETDAVNQEVTDESNETITVKYHSNIEEPVLVTDPQPVKPNKTNTTGDTANLPKLLLNQLVKNGIIEMEGECLSMVYAPGRILQLLTGDSALLTLTLAEEEAEEIEETDSDKLVMATESTSVKEYTTNTPLISNGLHLPTVPRCELCARTFASSSVLKRHMLVHSSVLPHTCHICGKGFKQRAVLTRHLLVHNDERPHKCPVCPASFTQRLALAAHARSHAPPGAKPLQLHRCQGCHKTFLHQSGLVRHMKTHLGKTYTCSECQRAFSDQSSLRRHARQLHPSRVQETIDT